MRRRPTVLGLVVPMVFAVLLLAPGRIWAGPSPDRGQDGPAAASP